MMNTNNQYMLTKIKRQTMYNTSLLLLVRLSLLKKIFIYIYIHCNNVAELNKNVCA